MARPIVGNLSKLALVAAATFVVGAGSARAADNSPPTGALDSPQYKKCYTSADSNPALEDCMSKEWDRVDKTMNQAYKSIFKYINDVDAENLRKSERDWLKFIESQCNFEYSRWGGGDAQDGKFMMMQCDVAQRQERLKYLEDVLAEVKETPTKEDDGK